jgi:tRNA dimethylallyltransferase
VRGRLEAELEQVGAPALHRRLAEVDPAAAAANSPNNARRIVRALEVIEITGRRFSAGPGMTAYRSVYADARLVGVRLDLDELDERIERRVALMWEQGLVAEVRALEAVGLRSGVTARRALGYQQVLAFLAGECSKRAARAKTVQATRRFVRRQLSWFRRDPRVHWIDAGADIVPKALAVVAD